MHGSVFWAQNCQIPVAGQFECQLEMGCMSMAGETALDLETLDGGPLLWQFFWLGPMASDQLIGL